MKPKFLVVDDHEDTRKMVSEILTAYDCECETASGGQDALDLLKNEEAANKFDAILLDIMMPDIHGFEVFQQLKEWSHTKDIPVIMVSAKGEGEDIIQGYDKGADYYITKPFTSEQIAYGLDMIFGDSEEN